MIVHTETDVAVDYLQRYYAEGEDGKPSYTGSRFESMATLNTDPFAIGPEDFVAVSMLSVDVPPEAAIRLLGPDAPAIRRQLSEIPVAMDIVDVDPAALGPGSPAGQLWELLRQGGDRLGPTKTSKLLAAKRPRLLPIWDSFVDRATGLETSVGYWQKFQIVLTDDQRRVWEWLGTLRPLAPSMPDLIPELRILDVLLWMSVRSRGDRNAARP